MKTKVLFRKFRKSKGGEVVALFPEIPATPDPSLCQSYVHIGQHCAADPFIVQETLPASEEDAAPLKRELEQIGYNLQVIKRLPRGHYETRKAALASR